MCYHCGNRTPHAMLLRSAPQLLYEIDDTGAEEEHYHTPFQYYLLTCGTCAGWTLVGGFWPDLPQERRTRVEACPRLYPRGPDILPADHTFAESVVVPRTILEVYRKAWPLRHINPAAFANQARRVLELICSDQGATGSTLAAKLSDLATSGVFPEDLSDTAALVRQVGNRGSHADERGVNIYDAELIDELLQLIMRYVYIGPSHRRRLRQRLQPKEASEDP